MFDLNFENLTKIAVELRNKPEYSSENITFAQSAALYTLEHFRECLLLFGITLCILFGISFWATWKLIKADRQEKETKKEKKDKKKEEKIEKPKKTNNKKPKSE
ncbi:hypothetical protein WA158_005132 [Blastocystis sp. Blastoise]